MTPGLRRLLLLSTVFASILLVGGFGCEPNNQGYQPTQPIAFSHKAHAGDLQIPCQYCHYASRRSRFAGIPPGSVCMNCHKSVSQDKPETQKLLAAMKSEKPIHWVRIHRLPDHTYFNHSAHMHAGLACQTCHGPVETMDRVKQFETLTMGWCLDCHREGGAPAIPKSNNTHLTECATCHH